MQFLFKATIATCSAVMAHTVLADVVPARLEAGGEFRHPFSWDHDHLINDLDGSISLTIDGSWMGFANIASVSMQPVQGATHVLDSSDDTDTLSARVAALDGSFDTDTAVFAVASMVASGGVSFTAPGTLSNGRPNSATHGGSLQLTGLRIDLTGGGVYADLEGANGVGPRKNQLIWRFADVERVRVNQYWASEISGSIGSLTFTQESRQLWAQALGLTPFGASYLDQASIFGTIDFAFSAQGDRSYLEAPVPSLALAPAVPEPSAWMLMGLGLSGLALLRRRSAPSPG